MVASTLLTAREPVDTSVDQAIGGYPVQQEEIDAQARIPAPAISFVVPERVHRLLGVKGPNGVDPTLIEQAPIARAAFRLKQRILCPRFGRIDIMIGRHDIEVTCEYDRGVQPVEGVCVRDETLEPSELVIEFRPWLRVAVRQVDGCYERAVHRRFDIAALIVRRIARKSVAGQQWFSTSREDGYAIIGALPAPDGVISGVPDRRRREGAISGLEFTLSWPS
jgi:hypothetical protein